MGLSLFDSSNKTKNETVNEYSSSTTVDNSNLYGQGGFTARGNIENVDVLDAGAIDSAFGFGQQNLAALTQSQKEALDFSGKVLDKNEAVVGDAFDYSTDQLNIFERLFGKVFDSQENLRQQQEQQQQQYATDLRSFAETQNTSSDERLQQIVVVTVVAFLVVTLRSLAK